MSRRKAPLRSSGPPERRTRVKPRNAARHTKNWLRAFHSVERVEFVRSLPCANCRKVGDLYSWIENAHTVTGGTSRRADHTTVVPLCATVDHTGCHDVSHRRGWPSLLNLDTPAKRKEAAQRTHRKWIEHTGGE